MPPRKQKNWPPKASLTLVDQVSRTVTVSTVGTVPGKVGQNKRTAADSQLASWTLFWGDGTQQGGSGQPPASPPPHTYQANIDTAVIRLVIVDVNTLTASATLTVNGLNSAPDPPTDLLATPLSDTSIQLTWADPTMTAQSFTLERRTGADPFAVIAQGLSASTLTYTNTGLIAATAYDYRVQAFNSSGASGYSNTASATTFPATPPVTPPTAPSALAATAISSTQIDLAWTDNASDESGFFIERQTGVGAFSVIATVAAGTVAFSDLTVVASTLYGYRVRAFNAAGNSAYSNTATATTPATPPPAPPAAPSALVATALTPTSVALAWTDNATTETNFQLERRVGVGAFTLLIQLAANITSYTDTGAIPSTSYEYRIRAINSGGTSGYSNTAAVTTPAVPPVNPPTARLTSSVTQLTLGETLTLSTVGTIPGSNPLSTWSINWTDGLIQNGPIATLPPSPSHVYAAVGTYTPVLTVTDTINNSDTDSPLPITVNPVPPNPTPPAAPTNLTAVLGSPTQTNLAWTDNATDEDGDKVERRIPPASFAQIATTGPNVTTFQNPNLTPSTSYEYRVRAFKTLGGDSPFSNVASISIPPSTPVFFSSWTTGNDTTGTGTQINPYKTIDRGAQALGPGSRLYLRGATYNERIDNNIPNGTGNLTDFTNAQLVQVTAFPGEVVTVKPLTGSGSKGVINLTAGRYIEFDGINIDGTLNQFGNVLGLTQTTRFVRYKNGDMLMGTTASFASIALFANDCQLQSFSVHGGGPGGCGLPCATYGVYCSGSRNLVEGFNIYDVNGGGLHVFSSSGSPDDNVFRNGLIHDIVRAGVNGFFGALVGGARNQVYNLAIYGLNLLTAPSGEAAIVVGGTMNKIWNSTLANNPKAGGVKVNPDGNGVEVRNVIAWNNGGSPFSDSGVNTQQSNNLFNINPLFVNQSANDFRLQAGSPAIDTGMTIAQATTDILGVLRPQGSAYDRGAYERPFP